MEREGDGCDLRGGQTFFTAALDHDVGRKVDLVMNTIANGMGGEDHAGQLATIQFRPAELD